MKDKREDMLDENSYIKGSQVAYRSMLLYCLKNLSIDLTKKDPMQEVARLTAERNEAIHALREICNLIGDNDWEDNLHLADIIDKHIGKHIEQ